MHATFRASALHAGALTPQSIPQQVDPELAIPCPFQEQLFRGANFGLANRQFHLQERRGRASHAANGCSWLDWARVVSVGRRVSTNQCRNHGAAKLWSAPCDMTGARSACACRQMGVLMWRLWWGVYMCMSAHGRQGGKGWPFSRERMHVLGGGWAGGCACPQDVKFDCTSLNGGLHGVSQRGLASSRQSRLLQEALHRQGMKAANDPYLDMMQRHFKFTDCNVI